MYKPPHSLILSYTTMVPIATMADNTTSCFDPIISRLLPQYCNTSSCLFQKYIRFVFLNLEVTLSDDYANGYTSPRHL